MKQKPIDANELMKLIPPEEMMNKLAIANAPTLETCAYWDGESNICTLHRPSAQPERKKGHWIDEETNYACSECHRGCWVNSDYCPWCGADMRGEKDE